MKLMRDMRKFLADLEAQDVPPGVRRAYAEAFKKLQHQATEAKADKYAGLIAARNAQSRRITKSTMLDEIEDLRRQVRNGSISAADARGRVRDFMAEHNRLTDTHNAIMRADDSLMEFYDAPVDDDYDSMADRFPAMPRPTLHQLAQKELDAQRKRGPINPPEDAPDLDTVLRAREER